MIPVAMDIDYSTSPQQIIIVNRGAIAARLVQAMIIVMFLVTTVFGQSSSLRGFVGPSGGQIFIDGFSGGQLPPKASIREIRINQNPFSPEYEQLGFGRIEILNVAGELNPS